MHHPPARRGAPHRPQLEQFYRSIDGNSITFDTWNQAKAEHRIVRECEALLLILAERMPYKTETGYRRRIDELLRDDVMNRTLASLRQLPPTLRPAPMNRPQVLSFALSFSSRYMRAHASSG